MNIVKFKPLKKIFLFALAIAFLAASCTPKSGITGTFTGLTNDTLWIEVGVLNDEYRIEHKRMDTVVVRDGKFFYNPQTDNLTELTIYPLENIHRYPNGMMAFGGPGEKMVFIYFPSNHFRFNAVIEDKVVAFQAKGNSYNERLSFINAITQDAFKQRRDALKILSDRSFGGDETVYQEQLREAMQVINNNELDYICANSDEPFSAYLVASYSFQFSDKILQYADSLGAVARNSEMGRILRKKIEDIYEMKVSEEESKKKAIIRKEMVGKPAPEFTLKDVNGNDFSLSSLRGKYVILDFWGSWCGGCLAAFPGIKKYYADHPNEFEIVGVAFSDKPETWRKMVLEKHNLPWINVFDDDNLHDKYYVTFAPTYFLIDKEGIIVDLGYNQVITKLNELREKSLL